jgi:hypothetical protein
MTERKLQAVLTFYRSHLEKIGLLGEQLSEEDYGRLRTGTLLLDHCLWMIKEHQAPQEKPDLMEDLEKILQPEMFKRLSHFLKQNRWLGFEQGCFAATQIFTINELRDHSRP